jgi:ribonuclease P protein component
MLPRILRLTRTSEYRAVYDNGKARRTANLVCIASNVPGQLTRAGIVASRRVGGAVQRNRAKRRLRHGIRQIWPELPSSGHHIVLIATVMTGKVDYARLIHDLQGVLAELGLISRDTAGSSAAPQPQDEKTD